MVPMLPRIDTFTLKCFKIDTLIIISFLSYQASFDHYKVKPYPPVCVALCDETWVL